MTPTESLISAIRSFDVDTVEKLLKSDFEIEYRHTDHHSVLHTAVALIASERIKIARFKEETNDHLNRLYEPKALRRIIEVLLDSGRFNVDALTVFSDTVLRLAFGNCLCKQFSDDAYKDMVNSIVKLLLKNNANVNARNNYGVTPLMMASRSGCSHLVQLLLNWRYEIDAGVDLNARDIYGETALIKAAKRARVDVIELLLKHGCLDLFQDHRGFCALHAVINGYTSFVYHDRDLMNNASRDFLALSGALASEETPMVMDRYAAHSALGEILRGQWPGNDSIQETVRLLVTRGRADINSKEFRGNTVLDLALESKLGINEKTVEKLKEYGATSSALLSKYPEYPSIASQYTDKLGKTPLHRLSAVLPELTSREKLEILMHRLNSSPHKEAFEEITVAKDHRGRTVLHYAVMPPDRSLSSDDIFQLINVLKLNRTINESDKYGRTPLHYCEDEGIFESLVEQGANERIQDIDGKTPRDLQKLRNEEHNRRNLPGKLRDQVYKKSIDAWMIWKDSNYAYRDQFSKELCEKVRQFMNRLSDEIRKKDPRFECRPVLIGSAEEGTKTGLPDEFDFNFILTTLGELCEIVPTPEAPTGFVQLKRKPCCVEYRPGNQHRPTRNQEDFDKFFNNDGFLLITEIACRFKILISQVMSEPEFWEGDDFFEWNPNNENGLAYDKKDGQYRELKTSKDFKASIYPCNTIQLKLNRPIEGRYMFTPISVDIVPCIKFNGWWPDEALSTLSDKIKLGGCHLMFEQPQKKYPWVPFSDPFARISFAPAEPRMIRECSAVARAAYMVGKQLLYNHPDITYVLKTCLMYCIEALKDCTGNSLLYEDINPAELRFFVEKLMLCFHEFYLQDFLPCYMMPSFHLPINDYLKSAHYKLLTDLNYKFSSFAYSFYSSVCITESPVDFCPPTPEPLNEKFNKEELMRKLSLYSSYIEQKQVIYRRVELETGQMARSDSQSGSQVRLSTNRKEEYR